MQLKVTGPARALTGTVRVPGDKSITHRALLLGAMAEGPSTLQGRLRAGVIETMQSCLAALGVEVEDVNAKQTLVQGVRWRVPARHLDCHNSGTTMRLLMGAIAGSQVSATLTGSRRLSQRPMDRVADPLRQMGAEISGANGQDQPPLSIVGTPLRGVEHELPMASAQVKTAIMLAGLHAEGETVIREPGASRDHTERLLGLLGVPITAMNGSLSLEPIQPPLPAFSIAIPGDFSAAAFLLAAAVLTPDSQITVQGLGLNPTRTGLLHVLLDMGASIETDTHEVRDGEPIGDLNAAFSELSGTRIEADRAVSMIDEFPMLAVLATQAHGETRVHGAEELRLKESDRLASMTSELRKLGARIEERPDGLTIEGPTPLTGAPVDSHGDHRVAMALTVAGALASGETIVSEAEIIQESFPGFTTALRSLGVRLE